MMAVQSQLLVPHKINQVLLCPPYLDIKHLVHSQKSKSLKCLTTRLSQQHVQVKFAWKCTCKKVLTSSSSGCTILVGVKSSTFNPSMVLTRDRAT